MPNLQGLTRIGVKAANFPREENVTFSYISGSNKKPQKDPGAQGLLPGSAMLLVRRKAESGERRAVIHRASACATAIHPPLACCHTVIMRNGVVGSGCPLYVPRMTMV